MLFAFLAGTILYILRRTTGSLIWAMLLHAFWDFATFSSGHGTVSPLVGVTGTLFAIVGVFALVAVWWVIRDTRPRTDPSATVV